MSSKFKLIYKTISDRISFDKECAWNSICKKLKSTNGFTMIELLVVMAIFAVISSVTIFNYGKFSSNLIVTNLAYEAALAVRQAQVYGISVKQTTASFGGTANFNASYGVWFSGSQDFYLFSDTSGDDRRSDNVDTTTGKNMEDEEAFTMNGSNEISDFCITLATKNRICKKTSNLDSMSIIFKRPEPNAKIYGFLGDTKYTGTIAEIIFTSGRGDKKARMTVTNTGQISVDSCNNPLSTNTCP